MTQKLIRSTLALCLFSCIALVSLPAQDYKPLIGKWSMTSETDEDPIKWTLLLKEVDGHLTASVAAEDQEMPVSDFTYSDGVLKFKAPYQNDDYEVELKVTAEKLVGTWSGGGSSGKTSGTKSGN